MVHHGQFPKDVEREGNRAESSLSYTHGETEVSGPTESGGSDLEARLTEFFWQGQPTFI
jgi:hypothetical protein